MDYNFGILDHNFGCDTIPDDANAFNCFNLPTYKIDERELNYSNDNMQNTFDFNMNQGESIKLCGRCRGSNSEECIDCTYNENLASKESRKCIECLKIMGSEMNSNVQICSSCNEKKKNRLEEIYKIGKCTDCNNNRRDHSHLFPHKDIQTCNDCNNKTIKNNENSYNMCIMDPMDNNRFYNELINSDNHIVYEEELTDFLFGQEEIDINTSNQPTYNNYDFDSTHNVEGRCSDCPNKRDDNPNKFCYDNKTCNDCMEKKNKMMEEKHSKCFLCSNNRREHSDKFRNQNKTCNDCIMKRSKYAEERSKRGKCFSCSNNRKEHSDKFRGDNKTCDDCLDKQKVRVKNGKCTNCRNNRQDNPGKFNGKNKTCRDCSDKQKERVKNGRCLYCKNNRNDHKEKFRNENKTCNECIDKRSRYAEERTKIGKCFSCSNNRKDHSDKFRNQNKTCNDCLDRRSKYAKERTKNGTCFSCSNNRNDQPKRFKNDNKTCNDCLEKQREKYKKRKRNSSKDSEEEETPKPTSSSTSIIISDPSSVHSLSWTISNRDRFIDTGDIFVPLECLSSSQNNNNDNVDNSFELPYGGRVKKNITVSQLGNFFDFD
eukprot:TRINITY_DN1585_c0_g1_i1.p1 TRINITY_DN1585_c0_g1~~TRINITY_DN1585_c0_g1_i1.p1  ORF type:complete len:612 (-),score=189.57 TRINITY_DN1585_c0_g1_i1:128-1924(-)